MGQNCVCNMRKLLDVISKLPSSFTGSDSLVILHCVMVLGITTVKESLLVQVKIFLGQILIL